MTPLDKAALEAEIRTQIESLKREIVDLESVTRPIPLDSAIGRVSRMDAINNRSVNEASLRSARDRQRSLVAALESIHEPGFGVCVRCGQDIPQGRLLLMPHSTRCVSCAVS